MADQATPIGCSFRASVPGETIASASGKATETESERWLPVVDDPRYEVSELGHVRRVIDGLLLKSWPRSGYLAVSIDGSSRSVHLLVADAFLGDRSPGFEVDHGDGDGLNPRLSNLEIVSHEENVSRAMARKYPGRPAQKGWRPDEVPWDARFHGARIAAALLLLALTAVGCAASAPSAPAVDITPDGCRALCAPRYVYSWTVNSCVCQAPPAAAEPAECGAR